ncbi:kinase-like protein [Lophiostoma macrostomum CBS 122681]|uniref:non-specific serine/threonine protein kinase n=1 Tax=Lophiostoma macrostomum CBS 122681 TaxID=1314788 RepID=A0A6A6TKF8_9PLEO|nr:kinase-like protein [Lophiostoma macrostomum CBS 122681]
MHQYKVYWDGLRDMNLIPNLSAFSVSTICEFYRHQRKRLSDDWPDSNPKAVVHVCCEDGDDLMTSEKILGERGFAIVDQVRIPTHPTPIVCARKKIGRVKQFKAQKQLIEAFVRELGVMRQVNHRHCTQLLGSYTDYDCVAILSLPVADMDLAAYLDLEHLSVQQLNVIRCGMACLCSALAYLHERKIRHEDLKPQNVLIHGETVLLTDFGFSLDFSDDSVSTTTGRPSHWTARYCAPESLNHMARNRATDIWSLGCILLEMLSRLCGGFRLSYVKKYWKEKDNGHPSYALNSVATSEWQKILEPYIFDDPENCQFAAVYPCIRRMLTRDRHYRPTARQVLARVADANYNFPREPPLLNDCCPPGAARSTESMHAAGFMSPEYFYPQIFKGFAFATADTKGYVIQRSNNFGFGSDSTPLSEHFESPEHLGSLILFRKEPNAVNNVFSSGRDSPETEEGDIYELPDGDTLALACLDITPMSTIESSIVRCKVRIGDRFEQRRVQIALIPICFPRSQLFGKYCVLMSFALEERRRVSGEVVIEVQRKSK